MQALLNSTNLDGSTNDVVDAYAEQHAAAVALIAPLLPLNAQTIPPFPSGS
jgi:hypothetical protein